MGRRHTMTLLVRASVSHRFTFIQSQSGPCVPLVSEPEWLLKACLRDECVLQYPGIGRLRVWHGGDRRGLQRTLQRAEVVRFHLDARPRGEGAQTQVSVPHASIVFLRTVQLSVILLVHRETLLTKPVFMHCSIWLPYHAFFQSSGRKHAKHTFNCLLYCTLSICVL